MVWRKSAIAAGVVAFKLLACAAVSAQPSHRVNLAGLGDVVTVLSGDDQKGIIAFSPAGDVDRDGQADLLLRFATNLATGNGKQDVVLLYGFSTPGGEIDAFSPGVRKTIIKTGFTFREIDVQQPGERAVSGGEDVNGDGTPDLLIASSAESWPDGGRGPTLLLILGGDLPEVIDGSDVGASVAGSRLFFRQGGGTSELGVNASLLPDVNGDGLAEIAALLPGFFGDGSMFVVFGSADFSRMVELNQTGSEVPGFVVTSTRGETLRVMAPLGDLDGDGRAEVGINTTGTESTDCFVIFGSDSLPASLSTDEIAPAFGVEFAGFDDLSGAGDMDGDGRGELLIRTTPPSNPDDAEMYLLRGRGRAEFPVAVKSAEIGSLGRVQTIIERVDHASGLGTSAPRFAPGAGGDLDGDGWSDAVFGIPSGRHVVAGPAAVAGGGAAYVVRGGAELPDRMLAGEIAEGLGVVIEGADPHGSAGRVVQILGDFDGDGRSDILVAGMFTEECERVDGPTDYKIWIVPGYALDRDTSLRVGMVDPARGSVHGGSASLLMGTGFDDETRVFVGGEEAEVLEVLGSGLLTVKMPTVAAPGAFRVTARRGEEEAVWGGRYRYSLGRTIEVSAASERSTVIARSDPRLSSLRGAAFAGDVNGDALADIALLESEEDEVDAGVTSSTNLSFVFGAASREDVSLDQLEPPGGVRISSPFDVERMIEFAVGGDVNNDGFDDVLLRVFVPESVNPNGWLLLPGRDDFPRRAQLGELTGVARVTSTNPGRPSAMAIVPDVTGDAYDDMLFAVVGTGQTQLFVLKGDGLLEAEIVLEDAVSFGQAANFGSEISLANVAGTAQDFDGNGSYDVLFAGGGLIQNGALAVLYMSPFFFSGRSFDLSADLFGDRSGLLIVPGPSLTSGLLFRAAVVPDMDGDLLPELFLRRDDLRGCTWSPRAGEGFFLDYETIVLGEAGDLPKFVRDLYQSTAVGLPDFVPRGTGEQEGALVVRGVAARDGLGLSVSRAGDFDGDGYEDAVLGAPGISDGLRERTAYVVRGGLDFYEESVNELVGPSDRVIQIRGGDVPGFGRHLSGGVDWDGDGTDDLLIAGEDARAFIVFGAGEERTFIRGDTNLDGEVNITDPVLTLAYLFQGGLTLSCPDAADADDDGGVIITDAIYTLAYLFGAGDPPPPPHLERGADPTEDQLDCRE